MSGYPFVAGETIQARRFVKISANRTVVTAGAGEQPIGVSGRAAITGHALGVHTDGVVFVTAGESLSANDAVEVGADGKAVVLTSGISCGTVLRDVASGQAAKIHLEVEPAAVAGVTDHGALSGLADDDHPQYATDSDLGTHAELVSAHLITGSAPDQTWPPTNLPGSVTAIAQTLPRWMVDNAVSPTTGTVRATAIWLTSGQVVHGITCADAATALNTGAHQIFGLYDSALNLLAYTTDDTSTAWGTHAAKRLAIAFDAGGGASASYTVLSTGLYYVAVLIQASTVPNLVGTGAGVAADVFTPARSGDHNNSPLTALPSTLNFGTGIRVPAVYAVLD